MKISMLKTQNLHRLPNFFNQFKKCLRCFYLKIMTNFVAMAYTKKQRQEIFTEQTPFSQNLCIFAPNKILMIKHDKRNYRKHSDRNKELINKSLSEVGAGRSILIDNENEIIAGNGVFEQWGDKPIKIIESDGSELIVVKRTDLSTEDPKRKQLAIMDNSASDSSEFDLELLCEDFESFELESFGVDLPTMEAEVLEAEEDDFDVPEGGIETDIVLGDLFEIGEHRLLCGDSTDSDSVAKLMNGEKADMVFTDPPYKIQTEGGCNGEMGKSLRKQGQDIEFISDFDPNGFLDTLPIVFEKNKMNAYIFCNKELLPDYLIWARDNGYSFNVLIWKKPNAIPIGDSHRPDIEYLLLFRKSAIWNNALEGVNYSRCLEFSREKGLHPTMKPIELISNEMKISSNVNNLVFDFFLGSGSTMVAAHQLKRKCYGMELDSKYCQVIIDRMRKLDPTIKIKKNGELI